MSDIGRWAALMKDTVTIAPYATQNGAGEATYGAAASYRARCVGKIRRITAFDGQERVSNVTTYLMAAPTTLTPRDQITLPAHFIPRTPKILAIGLLPDDFGLHHTVVYT